MLDVSPRTLTAFLLAYLGLDTFWGLISGWSELKESAARATTFLELRQAGERYAKVIGVRAARLFVMLATTAFGATAGLATKGPALPGFAQASLVAESHYGFRLAAVSEVRAVAISESGVTLTLAPGAMAMAARGSEPAGSPSANPRLVTQARDQGSHWGYQQWHRDVGAEVIRWLEDNPMVTPQQFEALLREIYSRPAMRQRFPCGFWSTR